MSITNQLRLIGNDISSNYRSPINAWKMAKPGQRTTGGFGAISAGIDLFTSNDGFFGKSINVLEGAASLAVLFSANPYLLFGVAAWFVGKAIFNAVTKGLPALFKGNITEAGLIFGKSALDIAFNCSALKIFKQFGISKVLNTGLPARSEASVSKLLVSTTDDVATATTKLTETVTTVGNEVKAAKNLLATSRNGIIATEAEIAKIVEREAAAKLATEAARKAAKEAAEALAKKATDTTLKKASEEAAKKLAEATAKEAAIKAEKEIAEQLLAKTNEAYKHASILLKNRRLALRQAKEAQELYKTGGLIDDVVNLQKGAISQELSLKTSGFAYDMTRVGFGDKEAEAAAHMAKGVRGAFTRENIDATVNTVKGAVSRVVPQRAASIPTYSTGSLPTNLDPLATVAIIA